MTLDIRLDVTLKGIDLVASTAYLTLVDKMGYAGKLLAVKHGTRFDLSLECDDPAGTAAAARRLFASQSYFYNINKHSFFLDCSWPGGSLTDGAPREATLAQLAREAGERAADGAGLYRSEVVIEDLDNTERRALAERLSAELGAVSVRVHALGAVWYLALCAASPDEARALADEIVVTETRDHGLLLNPNGQSHQVVSTEAIEAA